MDLKESIRLTKEGFERSFEENQFYNRQTQDDKHLLKIMDNLKLEGKMTILDLGTGNGYLAFPIAKYNKDSFVIGLDIVTETLNKNRNTAAIQGTQNVSFIEYDGLNFPFEDNYFDVVVTRYALHHFPLIEKTYQEISRVLKKGGRLFISDPVPNANDTDGFVDAFMQMKKDGHIKFYTEKEFIALSDKVSLEYENSFMTKIRFPRKTEESVEFPELLKKFNSEVIDGYQIEEVNGEIYITEQVLNISFIKR